MNKWKLKAGNRANVVKTLNKNPTFRTGGRFKEIGLLRNRSKTFNRLVKINFNLSLSRTGPAFVFVCVFIVYIFANSLFFNLVR